MNPESPPKTWIDRIQALFEVLLLSGLISSMLAGLLFYAFHGKGDVNPLASVKIFSIFLLLDTAITFVLLTIVLKARRESIYGLGLQWSRWKSNLALGLALVPILFLINGIISIVFQLYFPKYYIEENPITELIHTPYQLALVILLALISGGIKEELQRGFILTRFRLYLGGAGLGLVLWSLGFGAGHYVQGVQGIVVAAIYGFIFGLVYLLSKSLIAPIVAHGIYDALALLAYWIFFGRFK